MTPPELVKGKAQEFYISRAAHGGEGLAIYDDGRVIFIPGTYPGDHVYATVTQLKKNFGRAELLSVLSPSAIRTTFRCPAAELGAGCCDYATLNPENELQLKSQILQDQLQRLARLTTIPTIATIDLKPDTAWRTRVRLGVNRQGRAGMRKRRTNEIVDTIACTQPVSGLLDDIVGEKASRFRPSSELVAVVDDTGHRHLIETHKPARGRRSDKVIRLLEGTGIAIQYNGEYEFHLPATEFWQAHQGAIAAYSKQISTWCAKLEPRGVTPVAWDLFGGAGALVPPLIQALGKQTQIESVEASTTAAETGRAVFGHNVTFHSATVESALTHLNTPDVVLLDPPRTGAGETVITRIAATQPQRVIHIGCDPATFARDAKSWQESGYQLKEIVIFNAFPGTHHFETFGLLVPTP